MIPSSAGRSPAPSQVGFPLFGGGSGGLSRRAVMRGAALGAGAVALPAVLAACGDDDGGVKPTARRVS